MPRKSGAVPSYRLHKATGQAVVTIAGKDHYLGTHQSPESVDKYHVLIANWNQFRLPGSSTGSRPAPIVTSRRDLLINELLTAYVRHAKTYYTKSGQPTKELIAVCDIVKALSAVFGDQLASDFGPKALKEFRDHLISSNLCRKEVNKRIGRVKRIFKWAASEELIGGDQFHALQAVTGLKHGRTAARESQPVKPVDEQVALTTADYASPVVRDMIRLQLLTGMRPMEVTQMKVEDIMQEGPVWIYTVSEHKNKWRGHRRVVGLGPQSQAILAPYLASRSDGYLFSPAESERQRHQLRQGQLSSERKSKIYPSELKARERRIAERSGRKKRWGDRYETDSYRRAISYAIKKARTSGQTVTHWHPHQLRHTFATKIRRQFGAEGVQAGLGHANLNLVEVYAEKSQELLTRIAQKVG